MNVLGYVRVSTDEQAEKGFSLMMRIAVQRISIGHVLKR